MYIQSTERDCLQTFTQTWCDRSDFIGLIY